MRICYFHRVTFLTALSVVCACGQAAQASSPLGVATAGGNLVLGFGVDAVDGNPAHLGVPQVSSSQIRLAGVAGGLRTNSLGFDDYRKYNGATLTAEDKSDILASVPDEGLLMRAEAQASALAMRFGRWAITTSATASARGRVDHDALELLLYGNAHRPDWVFEDADAEGLAAWQVALSHGRQLGTPAGRPLYVGMTAAYVRGLYYAEASDAGALLETETDGLSGEGAVDWLTAEGGSGVRLDLGLAWATGARSLISLKAENLVHTVNWNRNVEVTHYRFQFDDITVYDYDDSLWTSDETTEAHADVSRGLPPQLSLGWGMWTEYVNLGLTGSVALADRFAASTKPRLSAAAEFLPIPLLTLRSGVAGGGDAGFSMGWGVGLNLGPVVLNTAVGADRAFWLGSGNGLSGAVSVDINM